MRLMVPTQVIIGVNVLTVVVIVGSVVAPYAGSAASGFTQGPYAHSISTRTLTKTETTTYPQGSSSSTTQTQTSPTLSPPSNAGGTGPSIAETVTATVTLGPTTTEVTTSSTTFTNTTTLTTTTTLPANTTTTTETATRTVTRTATQTTTATQTSTSTATTTVGYTSTATETVTSPSTTTATEVSTVTSAATSTVTATTSLTSTQTTTLTSTSTVTGATATTAPVPTGSSLTCTTTSTVGVYVCNDRVYSADLGILQGSVVWATSPGGGNFTLSPCTPTQQQWIQGSPAEVTCTATYNADTNSTASPIQIITASYTGDTYHAPSSQTYGISVLPSESPEVFVSVACGHFYPQVGANETCTATVTDANGQALSGTMGWTVFNGTGDVFTQASACGGSSALSCHASFTTPAAGELTITATYSGDTPHTGGSGALVLFPQDSSSYLATGAGYMVGGSILGGGLAIAAAGLIKRKKAPASAS
ncbi:MAG: hypothetical protein JRN30_04270 [Nitrososphaerota archaeon]|nr:hypothetical protein [Nitrososphaerota archaeon]